MAARNVVPVHGAFADGSSWSKVIPLLLADGHRVTSVAIPLTSYADDLASKDRMIAPEQEQSMATRIGAKTTTVPSSHAVMVSHPTEVARVIDEAARALAS
jgi:hypothetical protein